MGAEDGSGAQSVPMFPEDAVAGPNRKLPVSLSAQAVAEGWRGVVLGSLEKVRRCGIDRPRPSLRHDDAARRRSRNHRNRRCLRSRTRCLRSTVSRRCYRRLSWPRCSGI